MTLTLTRPDVDPTNAVNLIFDEFAAPDRLVPTILAGDPDEEDDVDESGGTSGGREEDDDGTWLSCTSRSLNSLVFT